MARKIVIASVVDWDKSRETVIDMVKLGGLSKFLPLLFISDAKLDLKAYGRLTGTLTQEEKSWINTSIPTSLALTRSKTLPKASTVIIELTDGSALLQSLGNDPLRISAFLKPLCRNDVNIYILHGN